MGVYDHLLEADERERLRDAVVQAALRLRKLQRIAEEPNAPLRDLGLDFFNADRAVKDTSDALLQFEQEHKNLN
jgi:hypothetical protein